jgi:phosphate-selective porin OprO and OprP
MFRSIVQYFIKTLGLGFACLVLVQCDAPAQQPATPAPVQEPLGGASLPQPAAPVPGIPALPATSREAALEQRIQQLEAMVNQLSYQVSNGGGPAMGPGLSSSFGPGAETGAREATGAAGGQTGGSSSGPGVPGQSFPPVPPVSPRFNAPAPLADAPYRVRFGPGFEIISDDEEWIMQFHNLTQVDFRGYLLGGQDPTHDTFVIPRQWFMWNGHLTKEVGYFVSLAEGIDTTNVLDVFVDFNYDRRLQIRAGRFKTPFTYEFFIEPIQGLITPERSLFFNNFGQNRDEGVMAYGQLFTNPINQVSKIQYAAGVFNGNRNGYIAPMDSKWFAGYLSFHPFGDFEDSLFENLNFGGSVLTGNNSINPAVPSTFRTVQATTGNAGVGIPFLTLNSKAMESGPMAFWDMHLAWFYRQMAIIGEWQSGYQDYALNTSQATRSMHTRVPIGSFYLMGGYLLTGETRSGYGIVKPNNPFSLRPGQFGIGAWEAFARYDYMDIGSQIFSNGLASTAGNANRLWMTDIGLTWHMTQYIKMFFDWNHVEFNNPATYNVGNGKTTTTQNTLWWRLQLFF